MMATTFSSVIRIFLSECGLKFEPFFYIINRCMHFNILDRSIDIIPALNACLIMIAILVRASSMPRYSTTFLRLTLLHLI